MADVITQVGSVLTAMTGWIGTILTTVVGEPLLMIPATLGLLGSAAVFIKKIKQ